MPLKKRDNTEIAEAINGIKSELSEEQLAEISAAESSLKPIKNEKIGGVIVDKEVTALDGVMDVVKIHSLYPAPVEWNLWHRHSAETMSETMESIYSIGVQQNIVVWEVPSKVIPKVNDEPSYMILAGHNRVDALNRLYSLFKDEKFLNVRALIYRTDEINEAFAKRVIDDTNLVRRKDRPKEIAEAYVKRARALRETETYKGVSESAMMEIIASEENTTRQNVYNYLQLDKLIEPLLQLVGPELSIKAGVKLASLNKSVQEHLYHEFWLNEDNRAKFNNKNIMKLKSGMVKSKAVSVINGNNQNDEVILSFKVPAELSVELEEAIKALIKDNT